MGVFHDKFVHYLLKNRQLATMPLMICPRVCFISFVRKKSVVPKDDMKDDIELKLEMPICFRWLSAMFNYIHQQQMIFNYRADDVHLMWTLFNYFAKFWPCKTMFIRKGWMSSIMVDYTGWYLTTWYDKQPMYISSAVDKKFSFFASFASQIQSFFLIGTKNKQIRELWSRKNHTVRPAKKNISNRWIPCATDTFQLL
jgi:hypothetical protein